MVYLYYEFITKYYFLFLLIPFLNHHVFFYIIHNVRDFYQNNLKVIELKNDVFLIFILQQDHHNKIYINILVKANYYQLYHLNIFKYLLIY